MRFLTPLLPYIFTTCLFCSSAFAQKKQSLLTKLYGPEQLKADVRILRDVVLKMHPAVGIYKNQDYYIKLYDSFLASLTDSLTEKAFRIRLKFLLNELHCGHTEAMYSKLYYKEVSKLKWNYSPYFFIPVKDHVYEIANLNRKKDSTLKKGVEIVEINGIPTDSIVRYSRRFISSDGFNQSAKAHYVKLGFNNFLLGLFSRPDTFSVVYKSGKELKTHNYPAFKTKTVPALPIGPKRDSLLVRRKGAGISYRYLDVNHKVFYMKLDKFSHTGFKRCYRKVFRRCKSDECENLILDLRNNGGGSLANSYKLLTYLIDSNVTQTLSTHVKNFPLKKYTRGNISFKFTRMVYGIIGKKESKHDTDRYVYTIKPRRKNHYNKRVFVLINGGSFSASCLVAAYLDKNPRVTFVGEETGGAIEGCNAGVTPYYTLPNTRLRVRIPAFRVSNDAHETLTGHGIMPDHLIEYSLQDIFSRKDLELSKVKELLKLQE